MSQPAFSPSLGIGASPALDRLLDGVARSRERTRRAEHAGRPVWVKRYDVERPSFGMRAHRLLTKVVRIPFWRPSRPLSPVEMVSRELRKYAAFRAAGLSVPDIVGARRATLVVADVGPSLARMLKRMKTEGEEEPHDALLVQMATALAEVHRAGLCHGRPHPRDMGLQDGRIAFFDFEEEPETVMPLADAQARDVWLLFLHITGLAIDSRTPSLALDAYARLAPGETQIRLAALVGSMHWIIPLGRTLSRIHRGGDLSRVLGATIFLAAATMGASAPIGTGVSDNVQIESARAVGPREGEDGDEDSAV